MIKYYKELEDREKVYNSIVLNNAWYINPSGNLYNTMGKNHHDTDLIRIYELIKYLIKNDIDIGLYQKKELSALKNLICSTKLEKEIIKEYIDIEVFNSDDLLKILKGIITSRISLYNYFYKIQKECKNPSQEIKKIDILTNYAIEDLLIRCCNFYKIEASLKNTITTSDLDYDSNLSNYILEGWKINPIDPIIFDNNEKTIKEVDRDFILIKRLSRD